MDSGDRLAVGLPSAATVLLQGHGCGHHKMRRKEIYGLSFGSSSPSEGHDAVWWRRDGELKPHCLEKEAVSLNFIKHPREAGVTGVKKQSRRYAICLWYSD